MDFGGRTEKSIHVIVVNTADVEITEHRRAFESVNLIRYQLVICIGRSSYIADCRAKLVTSIQLVATFKFIKIWLEIWLNVRESFICSAFERINSDLSLTYMVASHMTIYNADESDDDEDDNDSKLVKML